MRSNTVLVEDSNADDFTDFLIELKQTFLLSCSNYTMSIDSELFKKKFITMEQTPRTFGAFAKLKKDLKDKPVPVIQKDKLKYFVHGFKKDMFYSQVFNVDLKSAYATILSNDGLISTDTFDYLKKLTKQQRLAAVGMLASHKDIFSFVHGKTVSQKAEDSPLSSFFFYLVKRTSEIMNELKGICGQGFLFTWVDGIYFLPDEQTMSECAAYLDGINFPYSMEYLTDFKVEILPSYTLVTLKKNGESKPFSLPHADGSLKTSLKNALIKQSKPVSKPSLKKSKYETSKKESKKKPRRSSGNVPV